MLCYDRANTIMWRAWLRVIFSFRRGEQKVLLGEFRSLSVAAKLRLSIAQVNYPKLVQLRSPSVIGEPGLFRNFAAPRFRLHNASGLLLTQFLT